MNVNHLAALEALDVRLRIMLPEDYQDSYEDVQPVSMGSAGLKYGPDGKVAWNEIWATFCDLAMAGGPPHKGALLEPGTAAQIAAAPDRYVAVTEELCRGVQLVTLLPADPSPNPGWVRVACLSPSMAGWLLRAIVMENVAARAEGVMLDLPAAPGFRIEKEIKNVVTVIAKTCHYWLEHMPRLQHRNIASLFATLEQESPLVEPSSSRDDAAESAVDGDAVDGDAAVAAVSARIERETTLAAPDRRYTGWLGVECSNVRAAIWMMRALVVSNILSRREGTLLFVPVNAASDPGGERVVNALGRLRNLAIARGVL